MVYVPHPLEWHPDHKAAVAILWAAENGECLRLSDAVALRPSGETAIQDSVLILRVQNALFRCQHDKVEMPSGIARRLHLFREP